MALVHLFIYTIYQCYKHLNTSLIAQRFQYECSSEQEQYTGRFSLSSKTCLKHMLYRVKPKFDSTEDKFANK